MSNVLRLAIVDPNDAKRECAEERCYWAWDMIWLEAECSRYEFFADVVAQTSPDIGLVAIDDRSGKGAGIGHASLARTSPELRRAGDQFVATTGSLILQARCVPAPKSS